MWQSFGPDTHTGPIPWPPKVLYYAIFFGFGACAGQDVFEEQLGKYWWLSFLIAVLILLVASVFWKHAMFNWGRNYLRKF